MTITVETAIDDEHAETFYELYLAAFGPLRTRAAARQVLHQGEFFAEMTDARVWKYVAWADDDTPIALTTITKSPGDGALDQSGVLPGPLPRVRREGCDLLPGLQPGPSGEPVSPRTRADVPAGDEAAGRRSGHLRLRPLRLQREFGFADRIQRLLHRLGDLDVVPIDSQTYYYVRFD